MCTICARFVQCALDNSAHNVYNNIGVVYMSAFSNTLRALRKDHKVTQEELAKAVGVSKSSINMYERGEREPSIETLKKIAKYFHVSMNILLGNEEAYEEIERFAQTYKDGCRRIALKYGLFSDDECKTLPFARLRDAIFGAMLNKSSPDTLRLALSIEMMLLNDEAQKHIMCDDDIAPLDETLIRELIDAGQGLLNKQE